MYRTPNAGSKLRQIGYYEAHNCLYVHFVGNGCYFDGCWLLRRCVLIKFDVVLVMTMAGEGYAEVMEGLCSTVRRLGR